MMDSRFKLSPEDYVTPSVAQKNAREKGKKPLSTQSVQDNEVKPKKRKREALKPKLQNKSPEDEMDLYDEVLNGPLPSASTSNSIAQQISGGSEDGFDEEDEQLNLLPKPLQIETLSGYNSQISGTGIVYLSRIPPGMGPSKVKHILSQYGEIGRIYLVAADTSSSNPHKAPSERQHKHRSHRFIEGWIEFLDKRVAREIAELRNASSIGAAAHSKGSKKNGGSKKWRDDVWTMKYLPRFKWNMLSEQVAVEAATRAALLRTQLAQSKKEQAEYLRQVDRAKNHEKAQEKRRTRTERQSAKSVTSNDLGHGVDENDDDGRKKKIRKDRVFEQREVLPSTGKVVGEQLGRVLDILF